MRLGVAQRRQGIDGLARLRDGDAHAALGQRRLAVAELRGDLDLDRQARQLLEPVLGHHAGKAGRAAGGDGEPRDLGPLERQRRQRHLARGGIEIGLQRVADDGGLLVDLLHHEVAVVALAHHGARDAALADLALHFLAALEDRGALGVQHHPVVVLEIGDALGERRQRQRIGADIHLAVAVADGERAAAARAHQDVVAAAEQGDQGEGAAQALHRLAHRLLGRKLALEMRGEELGHHLGVGVAVEVAALGQKLVLQLLEVLDDAVVHDRDAVGGDGMGVALGGLAVGRPARVADADRARQRLAAEPRLEVHKLALGAPALDVAVDQGGDAGRIVAAIFQALQRLDQQGGDGSLADDSDDAAHGRSRPRGGAICSWPAWRPPHGLSVSHEAPPPAPSLSAGGHGRRPPPRPARPR